MDEIIKTVSGIRERILEKLEELGHDSKEKKLIELVDTIANGAGRFIQVNSDLDEVGFYPAQAFNHFYERAVPENDWPARWQEAGETCGDKKWLPWNGDVQTGRGVALKSSKIWEKLGNLRDDSLGNPFPPFAFNSGFDVEEISRAETMKLGLLEKKQETNLATIPSIDKIVQNAVERINRFLK